MDMVAATNNPNKLNEFRRFLEKAGHKVLSMADVGLELEIPEDGETFMENALTKAQAVCQATGMPALADDSGLCVDVLDGAPGVHSARFAGVHGDDEANNKHLMFLLERYPYAKRGAKFVSALALALPGGAVLEAEGETRGSIGIVPSGTGGFGYDPLFFVDNHSYADMTDEEKDQVSHRARAMEILLEKLPDFLAQNGGAI